jgi:hypothetical protein
LRVSSGGWPAKLSSAPIMPIVIMIDIDDHAALIMPVVMIIMLVVVRSRR